MSRNNIYKYYVEGPDDKRIVETLKNDYKVIQAGKVEVFNVNQSHFSEMRIRVLKNNTTVVLVYDTDRGNEGEPNLQWNIDFLKSRNNIKRVICIPQVGNLEEELVRACGIKEVKEITKSKSNNNFKSDLLKCTNLYTRLQKCKFDFSKFWKRIPTNVFKKHGNGSDAIRNNN